MSDVKEEISDMIKSIDTVQDTSIATTAPATSVPATSIPATEAPGTEAPGTTAPVTEAPPEPDEKDKEIESLRTKLAEKEVTKPAEKKAPSTEPPPEERDFIGNLDLDDAVRDPKEFNKLLNKIYQQAVTDTKKGITSTLPEIIRTNVAILNNLEQTSKQFYEDNPDLKGFKKVVATVYEELTAANPNKVYSDIIKEVAPEVRKRLELPEKKADVKPEAKKSTPPKLPSKGSKAGSPQTKPNLSPLQAELEEMTKTLRS